MSCTCPYVSSFRHVNDVCGDVLYRDCVPLCSVPKKRAPRALKTVKTFVEKLTRANRVVISPRVNKFLWQKGVVHVPRRVRIQATVKTHQNDDKTQRVAVVELVPVASFKGLTNTMVVE